VVSDLRAERLVFDYPGPLRAVDGVDLEVRSGELIAIIGPNGAGKSTLLSLFAGMLEPAEGRVLLGGRPLGECAPRERARQVAIVPQFLDRLPEVLVRDFVLGGRYSHLGAFGRPREHDREAVAAALEACDASGLGDRLLTRISGGQRQRVLIARALAQEAPVLLVDEPTSSLDPEHQLAVFDLLARQTCEGRAVLVVTHDLNLASQFATRMLLVQDGRIAAEGDAEAVLCREVLTGVYGDRLAYGRLPVPWDPAGRPFVLPWIKPS
jgi:iron complex transport system ATP-binding protein